MNTTSDTSGSAMKLVDPGRIGMSWGMLFALPALAFALFVSLDERVPYFQYIAQSAALLAAPLLLILAGVWWATHRRVWHVVLGAALVGLALLACLFAAIAVGMWSNGGRFPTPDAKPFLFAWGIFGSWALALALIVSLHVRRALRRTHEEGRMPTPEVADSISGRRFAVQFVLGLAAPLLLSVPVLLLLRYDIGLRNNANSILVQEVKKTKAQIGDIADYEKVRAGLLSRKQIIQTLEPYAAQTADALHVAGRLPGGLQLRSLKTRGRYVLFTTRRASAADQRAFVELLRDSGFRDIDVTRQRGNDDFVAFAATSTRMDEK